MAKRKNGGRRRCKVRGRGESTEQGNVTKIACKKGKKEDQGEKWEEIAWGVSDRQGNNSGEKEERG